MSIFATWNLFVPICSSEVSQFAGFSEFRASLGGEMVAIDTTTALHTVAKSLDVRIGEFP
jgi:hypothetical protein